MEAEHPLVQSDGGNASGPHLGEQIARLQQQPGGALLQGQYLVQTLENLLPGERRRRGNRSARRGNPTVKLGVVGHLNSGG